MGNVTRWILVAIMAIMLTGCFGRIETGNVGVRTEWNKSVQMDEVPVGFYVAVFSSVSEYVTKETEMKLDNQKPKAKDNLTIQDLDISVFYTVNPASVAEIKVKYANMTIRGNNDGLYYPGYLLIERVVRGAMYDTIAKFDSLTLHTKRNDIEDAILAQAQADLNRTDPGVFTLTKSIIRQVVTDPELEESIRNAVMMEKTVEAKVNELQLAKAEAERLLVEANGQAAAIQVVAKSLTPEYVTFKQVEVMEGFAGNGGAGDTHTIVIPSGMQPLISTGK